MRVQGPWTFVADRRQTWRVNGRFIVINPGDSLTIPKGVMAERLSIERKKS